MIGCGQMIVTRGGLLLWNCRTAAGQCVLDEAGDDREQRQIRFVGGGGQVLAK